MSDFPPSGYALLRVFLPAESVDPVVYSWLAFDAAWQLQGQGESAPAELPQAIKLELVIPAQKLAAHRLTLPQQSLKYQDALIAQGLEDRLLGNRQDIVAVPGPLSGSERIIWVCARSWLEAHLESFAQVKRSADRVFAAYELLPESAEALHYASSGEALIFRSRNNEFGIAEDLGTLSLLFGEEEKMLVPEWRQQTSSEPPGQWLTGELSRFRNRRFDLASLRPLAAMLAVVLSLCLLAQIVLWRQLENRENRVRHEIRQSFAALFPGTPIVDPLLQWESQLRDQTSGSQGDALDAVLGLAAKIDAPLKPKLIEANNTQIRITLSDTQAAQFKDKLERGGSPEKSPAEQGWTRLQYKLEKR